MIGNIVYLYLLDLENTLAVRQELIKDRFCKVIEANAIKGGSNDEQYMQYKLQSLNSDRIYTTNNYLSPYRFCLLSELEESIENISSILREDKLEEMKQILEEIKTAWNYIYAYFFMQLLHCLLLICF